MLTFSFFCFLFGFISFICFYHIYFFWVWESGNPNSRIPNSVTDPNFDLYYPVTRNFVVFKYYFLDEAFYSILSIACILWTSFLFFEALPESYRIFCLEEQMSNQSFDLDFIFSTLVEILNRSVTIFTKKTPS